MIRDDILASLNLTLLPLSAIAAYYSVLFQQHMAKKGYEDQPDGFITVVRCLTVLMCGIFFSAFLWLLWDSGFLTLAEQQNLSIIMRAMFLGGTLLFCSFFTTALNSPFRRWFQFGVLTYFISVYVFLVLN